MSIIYKGLNPKNHYGLCILTINGELITADGKHYQAIKIPTPHGRLIDADKIDYDEFWHREGQGFTIAVCQGAEKIIDEQPTILEAET